MKKNEMIKKIKFMEMAIEQGEKLDLLCRPQYDHFGTFLGLETFFMSSNMALNAITGDNNYYMVLNHKDVESKSSDIDNYIDSFCKCHELYDFDDDAAEIKCTCKLPSREEAEAKWYHNIIEKIEKRSEEIKKMIGQLPND